MQKGLESLNYRERVQSIGTGVQQALKTLYQCRKDLKICFTSHKGNGFGCHQNQFIFKDNDALQDVAHDECENQAQGAWKSTLDKKSAYGHVDVSEACSAPRNRLHAMHLSTVFQASLHLMVL